MSGASPAERLLRVLRREPVDRPPAVCMGGMMNAAIVDVMKEGGHTLPGAHFDAVEMAALAEDVGRSTGFENLGVPFCMTVEAELLGSEVDPGTLACEPKVAREAFASVEAVEYRDVDGMARGGRIPVIAEAATLLARRNPDVPVIASLTGPVSTAASIVDPMTFLKQLRTRREAAHRVLDYVTRLLVAYATAVVEAGADVVAIGDPTATGEILGPTIFGGFAVRYLNELTDAVHRLGVPVIVHICGDMSRSRALLPGLHADAISADAQVSLRGLKEDFGVTTMGNVSTWLLEFGEPAKVEANTARLVKEGVDIVAPACGLSTSTALANIRALTGAVKGS
ncbi:MAG TPA: uroporphyrinogen decarboxylase family protein [Anaeromyxobacteraceae bacterium]|nr:uroporphyrinogen decarboxylase family protein [Anaeromyxobacteraceae bacterium]